MMLPAAAAGVLSPSPPLIGGNTPASILSFPRRSPFASTLTLWVSAPGPPSTWGGVPAANPKYHNAKVDTGGGDVDGDELLRLFRREVARSGVMEEIRWRQRHEDARDKRKRKARSASRRFRRRHFKGPYPFDEEQELKEGIKDDDEKDNWELPGGAFPSYR